MYKLDKMELQYRAEKRGNYASDNCWYAVMVHTGKEHQVDRWMRDTISDLGASEVLIPVINSAHSKKDQTPLSSRLLFPSYLFIKCAMNDDIYLQTSEHRYVFQILGRAFRIPTPLENEEIDNLKSILNSGGNPQMIDRRCAGSDVIVVAGLLKGTRGNLLYIKKDHAKIEVTFSFLDLGSSVSVIVPFSDIRIHENDPENSRERILYA